MDRGNGWAAGNSAGGRGVRILGWGFPRPRWGWGNVSVAVFFTPRPALVGGPPGGDVTRGLIGTLWLAEARMGKPVETGWGS